MSLERNCQNTVHVTQKTNLRKLLKETKISKYSGKCSKEPTDDVKKLYLTKMSIKGKIIKEIIVNPFNEPQGKH